MFYIPANRVVEPVIWFLRPIFNQNAANKPLAIDRASSLARNLADFFSKTRAVTQILTFATGPNHRSSQTLPHQD